MTTFSEFTPHRLFLTLASLVTSFSGAIAAEAPRPNIIFVLADDLGPGDLGVLWQNGRSGTQKYNTPHLDQFAAEGKILKRHYCPASVCAPSRASLMLGVHQGHSNVRDNQFDNALENNHTVASVLKQAGYATANIGKWGLAGNNTSLPAHPQKRGFDYFFGYLNHGDAHKHYPKEAADAGDNTRIYDGYTNITSQLDKAYSTDFITARSKKWIIDQKTANPSQPFFLYLAYTAPHARLDVPTQAYPAGGGLTGGLQWTGTPGSVVNTASGTVNSCIHPDYASQNWPDFAKRHATMVRRLDDSVQDLIQTLKDLNIDENTLIVFTSDNGTHKEAGSGGSFTYNPTFFATYGPYDGIKRDLWEGGIRMPAIVRWPARIAAGSQSTAPSQFHDWLPTFAELAGVEKPERTDGVSILPTLTEQGTQQPGIVYAEYFNTDSTPDYADFEASHRNVLRNQQQVVQIGDFKAIRTNISTHESTDFRIYNVATDLKETTDLAGQPDVPSQREFKDRVLRLRRSSPDAPRPYDGDGIPSIALRGFANGLEWKAYEGEFPWVPDLELKTPVATGTNANTDLAVRSRSENIGIFYSGYLRIPADGTYQFHLNTDTGAFIRLHDTQLIDADFAYTPGTEKSSGNIVLKSGFHPIRIYYRHANATSHQLSLQWSGPGIAQQQIPATAFYLEAEPVYSTPTGGDDLAETLGHPSSYGTPVIIPVLLNDSDPDSLPAPLSILSMEPPRYGSAVISGTTISYTPEPGFFGEDVFRYTLTDAETQNFATVRIRVHAANDELWFPLDETEGNIVHEAGGRALGDLIGFYSTRWTTGKLSGGLRFNADNTTSKVILPGQKGITGTAARTIAFWLNADSNQGTGIRSTLISWGGANGSGAANNGKRFDINLNHTTSYRLRLELNGGGVNFHTPAISDPRGAGWIHVALAVPENATFASPIGYLNGQRATATYEGGSAITTAINTSVGNDIVFGNWASDAARPFRGILDDIRIYPRVLNPTEIAALASRTPEENAAAAWHFQNTGSSNVSDSSWAQDKDGDSLSTWLEYALGGNPNTPSPTATPRLNAENRTFTFNRRRSGIPASAYLPQISHDLTAGSWQTVIEQIVTAHPEDPALERVTITAPAPAPEKTFFRLRVDSPTAAPEAP